LRSLRASTHSSAHIVNGLASSRISFVGPFSSPASFLWIPPQAISHQAKPQALPGLRGPGSPRAATLPSFFARSQADLPVSGPFGGSNLLPVSFVPEFMDGESTGGSPGEISDTLAGDPAQLDIALPPVGETSQPIQPSDLPDPAAPHPLGGNPVDPVHQVEPEPDPERQQSGELGGQLPGQRDDLEAPPSAEGGAAVGEAEAAAGGLERPSGVENRPDPAETAADVSSGGLRGLDQRPGGIEGRGGADGGQDPLDLLRRASRDVAASGSGDLPGPAPAGPAPTGADISTAPAGRGMRALGALGGLPAAVPATGGRLGRGRAGVAGNAPGPLPAPYRPVGVGPAVPQGPPARPRPPARPPQFQNVDHIQVLLTTFLFLGHLMPPARKVLDACTTLHGTLLSLQVTHLADKAPV
jgi:hypothetical protein